MVSHIQTINYSIQVEDKIVDMIAIFNQNKLPTGVAFKCIETDTFNKYLFRMTKEQYVAIFLDDGEFQPESELEPKETVSTNVSDAEAENEN